MKVLKDQFDLLDKLPAPAAGKALEVIKGVLGEGGEERRRSDQPGGLGKAARGLLKGLTGQ